MATLEKPKQKKTKKSVPSSRSSIKLYKNETKESDESAKESVEQQGSVSASTSEVICEAATSEVTSQAETPVSNVQLAAVLQKADEKQVVQDVVVVKVKELAPSAPLLEEYVPAIVYPALPAGETSTVTPVLTVEPYTREELANLYSNWELSASQEFVKCFVESELRAGACRRHPLHELLAQYGQARDQLADNTAQLRSATEQLGVLEEKVWLVESCSASGSGKCSDGSVLYAQHQYQTARLQRAALEELRQLQLGIRALANEGHTLASYRTAALRLRIEQYLQGAVDRALERAPPHQGPAVALATDPTTDLRNLRLCISVLFWYERRGCRDVELRREVRSWLDAAVAALLRLADWQDHTYLLCQVLRCPPGVHRWAARYVQVPLAVRPRVATPDIFTDRHVTHALAVLSVLLRPIDRRDEFLEQAVPEGKDPVAENLWVLVDSEGEEDTAAPTSLKENDLVALLNQIPFAELFRHVLGQVDDRAPDETHVLRLFAFCSVLVELLDQGLKTYGPQMQRYHQFVKRLCRLVRHSLQYASDCWELSGCGGGRLQVEFDSLFVRCGRCLYEAGAQGLGAWQFLAVLPFATITSDTLWRFFCLLHEGEGEEPPVGGRRPLAHHYRALVSSPEARHAFEERLCVMGVEESYYLLNAFANMIMGRTLKDYDFIKFATINLLQIGFIGQATQESCSKCAAILLSNITTRYPTLISEILSEVNVSMDQIGQLSLYLFRELPLHIWRITESDLTIISDWILQHPPSSVENHLSRLILLNLNWSFDTSKGVLWLGFDLHVKTALLTAEAVMKWNQNGEKPLTDWSWKLVYRLKLHSTDRGVKDMSRVPELARYEILSKGVRSQHPLCSYLALMMTTTGHLVPMICSHGFTQLHLMLSVQAYEPTIVALHSLTPLFLDCPESLVVSPQFQEIIQMLLLADKTYMKMAKSLITTDFPGQILKLFSCMVEYQINNPQWRGLVSLYVQVLVGLPNWNKDNGVLHLLDMLVRSCYLDREMYRCVSSALGRALERAGDRAGGGSLLGWMSAAAPALLPPGGSHPRTPWLANLCLEVEHDLLERRTGLWEELLRQLCTATGRTNVDSCLKRACSVVKLPSFGSGGLCLYRRAQLALDCALDHPLLPILWQRFFHLYLARVPAASSTAASSTAADSASRGCVGSKFFDGVVNGSLLKRLKRRLSEGAVGEGVDTPGTAAAVGRRRELQRAYALWLEEPLLQEASLYLPALPPQYEPRLLAAILNDDHAPWTEALHRQQLQDERQDNINTWLEISMRKPNNRPNHYTDGKAVSSEENESVSTRMSRRLESYDRPCPPPNVREEKRGWGRGLPQGELQDKARLQAGVQPALRQLEQLAELYTLQKSEHCALDSQFLELLPHLYRTHSAAVKKKKTCGPQCARAANITVKFNEGRLNEGVRQQVETNRANVEALLSSSTQPAVCQPAVVACSSLEAVVEQLCAHPHCPGAHLYFLLLDTYREQVAGYPPARQAIEQCADRLAERFVTGQDKETARLCRLILDQPANRTLTVKHFNPRSVGTGPLLQMYADIVDKTVEMPDICRALLSKLDIATWLVTKHPRLSERSQFITLVFTCLTRSAAPPPAQEELELQCLARRHLVSVFRHDFPEHYGEVLRLALVHSGTGSLPGPAWRELLAALVWPADLPPGNPLTGPELRHLSATQKMLRQDMLMESTSMLGRYFSDERLRHGPTFGLYPRYRSYVGQLADLLSFISHSLVSTAVCNTGAPGDRLLEVTWPRLLELWGPWILPLPNAPASSHPWLQPDSPLASRMFSSLVQVLGFLMDALPANTSVLCYTWQFYAQNFTYSPPLSGHILSVVHSSLLLLPWRRFWPSVQDLETMLRVSEQYLPDTHTFLCYVFLEVDWAAWLTRLSSSNVDIAVLTRVHHCLLGLLVKAVGGEEGRCLTVEGGATMQVGGDRACQLLNSSRKWSWKLLRPGEVAQVLDWYIMSVDPRVALVDQQVKRIDIAVLELLTTVCCFDDIPEPNPSNRMLKRQSYLRACMKLIMNCASRHKTIVTGSPLVVKSSLVQYLNTVERVVRKNPPGNNEEPDLLLTEILSVTNNASLCPLVVDCVEGWLKERPPSSPMLFSVLRTAGMSASGPDNAGRLLEAALTALWAQKCAGDEYAPSWESLAAEIRPSPSIEPSLAANGRLLTLHAIVLKRMDMSDDCQLLMDSLTDWLAEVKITEATESLLPLLWCDSMSLASRASSRGDERSVSTIRRLAQRLSTSGESGGSGGLWGALGRAWTGGARGPTPRARLLSRCLSGYLLAQLTAAGGVRHEPGQPSAVGQPGGSAHCPKLLMEIAQNTPDELKHVAQMALKQIQDPQNSMHNAVHFSNNIVRLLYSKPYLNTAD